MARARPDGDRTVLIACIFCSLVAKFLAVVIFSYGLFLRVHSIDRFHIGFLSFFPFSLRSLALLYISYCTFHDFDFFVTFFLFLNIVLLYA